MLQHSPLAETDEQAILPEDDVVEDLDPEELASSHQPARESSSRPNARAAHSARRANERSATGKCVSRGWKFGIVRC